MKLLFFVIKRLQINSTYFILSLYSLIAQSLQPINNQLLTYMHLENVNLMKQFLVILCYIHRLVSGLLSERLLLAVDGNK